MDKLAEIWDQLTLNQRSCPVDRKGRLANRTFGLTLNCRAQGPHALRRRRTHGQADTLRNQNIGRSPKCTPTRKPSCAVGSLLIAEFELRFGSPT